MTLELGKMLKHVAIIMDGNRRWAKDRGLPSIMGHREVVEKRIEELIDHAGKIGIEYITFWAFSTENWDRPGEEVKGIMNLFKWALENKAKRLIEKGAKLKWMGDLSKFEPKIREGFEKMAKLSEKNTGITVTFGLNYGGRDEIVRGIRRMISEGEYMDSPLQITKERFGSFLDTGDMPDPDLIIRTGGEQRLSGFMLWQCEYSEFYFTKVLMPDFGTKEFDEALEEYGRRQRRRGR